MEAKPDLFLGQKVLSQLRSNGVLETVKLRKAGYAVRLTKDYFYNRYASSHSDALRIEDLDSTIGLLNNGNITCFWIHGNSMWVVQELRFMFSCTKLAKEFPFWAEGNDLVTSVVGHEEVTFKAIMGSCTNLLA